jgi:hypothetical protein
LKSSNGFRQESCAKAHWPVARTTAVPTMFLVNEPSVHAFACPRVYVLGAMIGGPRALVRRGWPLVANVERANASAQKLACHPRQLPGSALRPWSLFQTQIASSWWSWGYLCGATGDGDSSRHSRQGLLSDLFVKLDLGEIDLMIGMSAVTRCSRLSRFARSVLLEPVGLEDGSDSVWAD